MSQAGMEYLSFSRLSTYDTCGERFRLRYVDRVPSIPSGAAIGGSAVHQVIETAELEGWWEKDFEDAVMLLTNAFRAVFKERVEAETQHGEEIRWGGRKTKQYPMGEDFQWWDRYAGNLFLRRYLSVRKRDAEEGWRILDGGVEMEIGAYLDDRYIKGFIDALGYVTGDGEVVIRDWKTGTWLQPFQLAVYAWMVQQSRGLTVTRGQIGYLRGSSSETWIKEYDLSEWIDIVPRKFTDLVRGIEAQIFPIQPSNLCGSCAVRPYCAYGKTLTEEDR